MEEEIRGEIVKNLAMAIILIREIIEMMDIGDEVLADYFHELND